VKGIFWLHNNELCGNIPLELNNRSDFNINHNHLTASDPAIIAWLDELGRPDWATTQTPCPGGFFTAYRIGVAENASTVTLTVRRGGETNGTLEVDYATTDGSALDGSDYVGDTGRLTWLDGDSSDKTLTITLIDNTDRHGNKTFTVTLSDPTSGANLETATVIIIENEHINCADEVTEIPEVECEALIAFYNSTNGDYWPRNEGWKATNTPCSWYGITCDDGHVTRLQLRNNGLSGSIPSELGNLSHLHSLYLYNNQLSSIPAELGNLSNLSMLQLSYNKLSSIPAELGNLSSLEFLSLGDNEQLSFIPAELGNLSHLHYLYLYNTKLSSIPAELGNLSNLETLYLSDNQLSSIPAELGNLSRLSILYLSNNQLSSIPAELGNLSNLHQLHMSYNQLSSIPAELGNLSNLSLLLLRYNQLSSIPAELGNLSNLTQLYLSNNQLSFIPAMLWNLSNLSYLNLSNNQLSGSIPAELGNLSNLRSLYLNNNELCGNIPTSFLNLNNMSWLNLGYNHLTASDPALIAWLDEHDPDWATTQTPCPVPGFTTSTVEVAENAGTVTLTVRRGSHTNGTLEVDYATADGTAGQGTDYIGATGRLTWLDGDTSNKTLTITLIDNTASEDNKTFTITLSDPTSGADLETATVIIRDDDPIFVSLAEFTATALETTEVRLEWQTAIELDNAGFHIWRATGEGWKSGDYSTVIRLTARLIPAQGNSSLYSYIDADVSTYVTYYYGLEDIDLYGQSTFHWDFIESATAK
jgi:Leucine-rich repeat (LRR) protein